jgi:hypothetical protein
LLQQQIARIECREIGHCLDIALGDEQIEQAAIVEVGEFAVPTRRWLEIAAGIGNVRRGAALAGDVAIDRRLPLARFIWIELLQFGVAHPGLEMPIAVWSSI